MRIFADAAGVVWTIFEVKKQGGPTEQWTYLPEQYGNGWLCFESSVSKRRLTPVPPRWIEYSDKELARLLDTAEPVVRPRHNAEVEPRPECTQREPSRANRQQADDVVSSACRVSLPQGFGGLGGVGVGAAFPRPIDR